MKKKETDGGDGNAWVEFHHKVKELGTQSRMQIEKQKEVAPADEAKRATSPQTVPRLGKGPHR